MQQAYGEDNRHPLNKALRRHLRNILKELHQESRISLEAPATEMVTYILQNGLPWETVYPDGIPDSDIYSVPAPEPRMKRAAGDLTEQQNANKARYYESAAKLQKAHNQEIDHHQMKWGELRAYAKKLGIAYSPKTNKAQLLEMIDGHPLTRS